MEHLKSLRLLVIGVLKRIYWILPTLLLNPFDIVERLFNVSYEVPQWAIWSLFAAGWVVAILLAYHELRMQKVALEQPPNWIDAHKAKTGKLPPLPDRLASLFRNYSSGQPVSKGMEPITPSGQTWDGLRSREQKQWQQVIEWLGEDPEDYLEDMRKMLPKKAPKGAARWKPPEQR
jgi:hypothetical protein